MSASQSSKDAKSYNTTATGSAASRPQTFEEMACSETSTVKSVEAAMQVFNRQKDIKLYGSTAIAAARHDQLDILEWIKKQLIDKEKGLFETEQDTIFRFNYTFLQSALVEAMFHNRERSFFFLLPLAKLYINQALYLLPAEISTAYPNVQSSDLHVIDVAVHTKHFHFIDSLLSAGASISKSSNTQHTIYPAILRTVLNHEQIMQRLQKAQLDLRVSLGSAAFKEFVGQEQYRNKPLFLNNLFQANKESLQAMLENQLDDYLLSKLNQFSLDDVRSVAGNAKTEAMKYLLQYFVATKEYQNAKIEKKKIQNKIFTHYQEQWQQTAAQLCTVSSAVPQTYLDEVAQISKDDKIVISTIAKAADSKDAKAQAEPNTSLAPLLEQYSKDVKATVKDIEGICYILYQDRTIKNNYIACYYIGRNAAFCGNLALLRWSIREETNCENIWFILHDLLAHDPSQDNSINYLFNYLIGKMNNFTLHQPRQGDWPIAFLLIKQNKSLLFDQMLKKYENERYFFYGTINYDNGGSSRKLDLFTYALVLRDRPEYLRKIITHVKKPNFMETSYFLSCVVREGRDELMDEFFRPDNADFKILLEYKKFNYLNKVANQFSDEIVKTIIDQPPRYPELPLATIALFKTIHAWNQYAAIDAKVDKSIRHTWFEAWVETVHDLVMHYSSELKDHFPAIAKQWLSVMRASYAACSELQLEAMVVESPNPCVSYFLCQKYFAANDIQNAKKHYALASPLFTSEFSEAIKNACYVAPISPPAVAPSAAAVLMQPTIADLKAVKEDVKTPTSSSTAAVSSAIASAATPADATVVVVITEGEGSDSMPVPPGGVPTAAANPHQFLAPPAATPAAQPNYIDLLDSLLRDITLGAVSDPTQLALLRTKADAVSAAIAAKPAASAPAAEEGAPPSAPSLLL